MRRVRLFSRGACPHVGHDVGCARRHAAVSKDAKLGSVIETLKDDPGAADALRREAESDPVLRAALQRAAAAVATPTPIPSAASERRRDHGLGNYSKLFLRTALPFFGFGVCDNIIMITVGDAIDNHFGVIMGFSTMVAAGLGQAVSDGSGITIQQMIERSADRLGLPEHTFSEEELRTRRMSWLLQLFRTIGIVSGCLCGLVPVVLTDTGNKPRLYDTLLQALPEERRRALSSKAVWVNFSDQQHLLTYGEDADAIYSIQRGQVRIVGRNEKDGEEVEICHQGPGTVVGHLELAFGHRCVADVIAEGDVKALKIPRRHFEDVLGTDTETIHALISKFVREDPDFAPYRWKYPTLLQHSH